MKTTIVSPPAAVDKDGDNLDGAQFVHLRDAFGAWIETTEPARIVRSLGLPSEPMPKGISSYQTRIA